MAEVIRVHVVLGEDNAHVARVDGQVIGELIHAGVHLLILRRSVRRQRVQPRLLLGHVGAGNPVTSWDLHVFVYEAAEPVSS